LHVLERDLGLVVELVEPGQVTPAGNADVDWGPEHALSRQLQMTR